MEVGEIEALLNEWHVQLPKPTAAPNETFTFASPHSCAHCQDETLQIQTGPASTSCYECGWQGVGSPGGAGHRLCGGCGRPHEDEHATRFRTTLRHGLKGALAAAESGCALYRAVLDLDSSSQTFLERVGSALKKRAGWDEAKRLLSSGELTLFGANFDLEARARCGLTLRFEAGGEEFDREFLKGWTTAGSAAAKYIAARPYELDVDSAASWDFARHCLETCRTGHAGCREDPYSHGWVRSDNLPNELVDISAVPSRLLDVSPGNGLDIRLVEIESMSASEKDAVSSSGFVALSYCWGQQQSLILTQTQSRHLLAGFSTSELPLTIRDAVRTVRQLGLRYIWVDALCIYQDNDDDKAREIGRMGSYYGSAALTICAAAASKADEGFLHHREPAPFAVGPIRMQLTNTNGDDQGHIHLLLESPAPPEPTTTRGWTMQESLLSRRILVYAQRQLYWGCSSATAGCGGDQRFLLDVVFGAPETLVDNIHPIGPMLQRPVTNQWRDHLRNYTARSIGFSGDKLPAVSAMATRMLELCRQRGEECNYVAGFIVDAKDPGSWLRQMLWSSLDPGKTARPSAWRVPSWSWAAVDGPLRPNVDMTGIDVGPDHWVIMEQGASRNRSGRPHDWEQMATVTGHEVELERPDIPFGSVKSGHLLIEARQRRVSECVTCLDVPFFVRSGGEVRSEINHIPATSMLELLPDTDEDVQTVIEGVAGRCQVSLVLLQSHFVANSAVGLIVAPDGLGEVRRIGIFRVIRRDVGSGVEVVDVTEALFGGVSLGLLRIV